MPDTLTTHRRAEAALLRPPSAVRAQLDGHARRVGDALGGALILGRKCDATWQLSRIEFLA